MAEEYGDLYRKFPLTKGEQLGIVISDEETKGLRVKGEKCLVGRLGVAKNINKEAFKTLLICI
jgi:hypothetical protein